MLSRRQFAALSGALAASAIAAPVRSAQSPGGDRRAEVLALRGFAELTHPLGKKAALDPDWRRYWEQAASQAAELGDGAYFLILRRALGWFGDGHTTLLPFEFTGGVPGPLQSGPFRLALPVRVRLFHDGAHVVATRPAFRQLLGARMDSIGRLSAAALMRRIADRRPGGDVWAHRWGGPEFTSPALLEAYGAIADPARPVSVEATLPDGRRRTVALVPSPAPADASSPLQRSKSLPETWAESAGGGNYLRDLPESDALYLSIDSMGDLPTISFDQLTDQAVAAFARPRGRLIVDLRRNGGGNNYLGERLRKAIAVSSFNQPGRLYVLIAPPTFSAAQNLANRLERETASLFVGEPTGGAPNHYGDAKSFTGPVTGITPIVSTIPWFDSYPQDERRWIMPDLPAPALFGDWLAGEDSALSLALGHRFSGSASDFARQRVRFFERPSQQRGWAPFWRSMVAS